MGLIIAISTLSNSLFFGIKLFLFEIVPSIYLQIFTPLHLFFLLNLLIISIFAITHLCKEASPSRTPPRRSSLLSKHEIYRSTANHADNQTKFAGIMLNDDGAGANHWNMVHESVSVKRLQAKNLRARSDQLRRRGDRVVHWAQFAESVHSDDISAAKLMAQYNDVFNDGCSDGHTANDPHLHPNQAVVNEVINVEAASNQAVIKEAISEIVAEIEEQKSKIADFHDRVDRMGSADDHLLISESSSSLDPDLKLVTQGQERPLASTRFSNKKITNRMHVDMLRSNSPLKVSRSTVKRGDTLEATWKAICENKTRHSSPLARHHKTSYTKKVDHHINSSMIGDTNVSKRSLLSPLSPSKQRHHMPTNSSSGLMRRRELSIPRDELNARVESFISKFNQQIRIQREESLLNYRNMVSRGAT